MEIEGTVDLEIRSQPGSKAQSDGQGIEDPEDVVDVGSGTGPWQLDRLNVEQLAIKLTEKRVFQLEDIVYPRVWIYSSRDPNRWVSVCAVPSSGVSGHGWSRAEIWIGLGCEAPTEEHSYSGRYMDPAHERLS
ncbi:hypothetical protein FBULB1_3225 [Fusarium bulbicola]|nr:hypothetical protein FBULB1_3225 [Fusarium bulbicola]